MNGKKVYLILLVLLVVVALVLYSRNSDASEQEEGQRALPTATAEEDVRSLPAATEETKGKHKKKQAENSLLMVKGKSALLLTRVGYITGYSQEWKCPQWTAWHLTADHTTGPYKRKGVSFHEDGEVPYPKALNSDYYSSGYDRGHMCPSGDNKWDRQAQEDCFLFTNMCPQAHNLNSGDWNDLEIKCRTWAKRYGDIYIVCGPVFHGDRPKRTIGKNKVWVPDGFYKVVLRVRSRGSGDGETAAIGFYYDNDDGHQPMSAYVRSVDEIERMTGLDFFSALDDKTENRVEAHAEWDEWR